MRVALGPGVVLAHILQGLFHPARKVREVYWHVVRPRIAVFIESAGHCTELTLLPTVQLALYGRPRRACRVLPDSRRTQRRAECVRARFAHDVDLVLGLLCSCNNHLT